MTHGFLPVPQREPFYHGSKVGYETRARCARIWMISPSRLVRAVRAAPALIAELSAPRYGRHVVDRRWRSPSPPRGRVRSTSQPGRCIGRGCWRRPLSRPAGDIQRRGNGTPRNSSLEASPTCSGPGGNQERPDLFQPEYVKRRGAAASHRTDRDRPSAVPAHRSKPEPRIRAMPPQRQSEWL